MEQKQEEAVFSSADETDELNVETLPCKSVCVCVFQTGLSGNMMILSVLYKGGLLMASQHMSVGELSSFLIYTFWVGISMAGNACKHT